MNLTIDIGNTRAKLVVFEGDSPVYEEIVSTNDIGEILKSVCTSYQLQHCAWCSVSGNDDEIKAILSTLECPVIRLTGTSKVPLNVCYQSKETLGADRLAAVIGATTLYPQTGLLVIDAGTCITYDLVDAQGNYLGGNISPGIEMRLKALHHFTARLPKVEEDGNLPKVGINTETAIRCGVVKGMIYEMEGYLQHLRKDYPQLRVFLTGGSSSIFSEAIEEEFLSDPYLVSRGLNRLLCLQNA